MKTLLLGGLMAMAAAAAGNEAALESDIITTSGGDLKLTFIGHGTLMFEYGGLVIHIDPVARYGSIRNCPRLISSSLPMSTATIWIRKP